MVSSQVNSAAISKFRPPAVPLITSDPYFSVWSMSDKLTDQFTEHWTDHIQAMCGMVRIDNKPYRFMSKGIESIPAMNQVDLQVLPTRTIYKFEADGVRLTVTFLTPLLADDLDVMSRPTGYIELTAKSIDGRPHEVKAYLDATAEFAVNSADQKVSWKHFSIDGDKKLQVMQIGTAEQPILQKCGDDLRIDWGYLYLSIPDSQKNASVIASSDVIRKEFADTGTLPSKDDTQMPKAANDGWTALACTMDMGKVGQRSVSRMVTLTYDDIYSAEYFHNKLRPYWRRNGMDAEGLIKASFKDYSGLKKKCTQFDKKLLADAKKSGGKDYADIVAISYRQAITAHKLAAYTDGTPFLFPKENFSNGCMGTVDVIYPSSPIFMLLNTKLLKAMLDPVMKYAESPEWPNNFAPHDLGTYPLANGQVYGGGAKQQNDQMPVEESGDMLIMLGAMSHIDGNADYAKKYWPIITKWADYLKAKGLDPENQLCTDDFAGHLAHNTNLSLKAIIALKCYSIMADMLGKKDVAAEYSKTAAQMAKKWKEMASEGDHYKLAFDQPNTWSMKYNLVWDKILNLHLFDPSIAQTEIAYYKTKQNKFGLPLDNRKEYTKSDWLVWTATLANSDKDFKALIAPLHKFICETPDRVPFTDWYWTNDAKVAGFRARSVVGGVFIKMLSEPKILAKWKKMAEK